MDPTVNFYVPILLALVIGLVGWTLAKVNDMAARIRDLHVWHQPDDTGQQSWKNHRVDQLCDKVDDLTIEMRELVILFKAQQQQQSP